MRYLIFILGCFTLMTACETATSEKTHAPLTTDKSSDWYREVLYGQVKSFEERYYKPNPSDSNQIGQATTKDEQNIYFQRKKFDKNGYLSELQDSLFSLQDVEDIGRSVRYVYENGRQAMVQITYQNGVLVDSMPMSETPIADELTNDTIVTINPDSSIVKSIINPTEKGVTSSSYFYLNTEETTPKSYTIMQYDTMDKIVFSEFVFDYSKDVLQQVYRYNEWQHLSQLEFVKNDTVAEIKTYQYEYDAQGNWMKCILLKNGKTEVITTRKLVYYE